MPDTIDLDPALGVPSFDPAECLARARRASIDCLGLRHDTEAEHDRKAILAAVIFGPTGYSAALSSINMADVAGMRLFGGVLAQKLQGVPADLAEYTFMTGGWSADITNWYSGPERFAGQTLVGYLAAQKEIASRPGAPSGG